MNKSITKSPIFNVRYTIPLLLLANSITWAEISSLSPEELTDTYIKDTTIIVRQQKTEEESTSAAVKLKITPLEQATQLLPQDQTHSISAISHELTTYDALNNQRALDNNLAPQLPLATTEFLKAPVSEATLDLIRQNYGLAPGEVVDLTALPFLTNITPANPGDIPVGSSYVSKANSFTIRIPNVGNYNTQQINSPNGEIGVNVTPTHIEYTLNLPK